MGYVRMMLAGAAASVTLAATVERAAADFVFSMEQAGPNVLLTGEGRMYVRELFGDMEPTGGIITPRIDPQAPSIIVTERTLGAVDAYRMSEADPDAPFSITGPSSFGTGSNNLRGSGSGNDPFGFAFTGSGVDRGFTMYVPQGYTGSDPEQVLSNSVTFANQSFASLAVTPGSYTWVLQSVLEPFLTETIVLNIQAPVPVPLPPTGMLLAAGLLGLAALARRPTPPTRPVH